MRAAPWHPVRRPCRARNDARLRGRASTRSHESGPSGEQARRAEGGVCSVLRKRDGQRTGERSLLLIGRARLTRRDRRRDRNGAWNAAWYQAPHEQQRNARHSHRLFLAASLLPFSSALKECLHRKQPQEFLEPHRFDCSPGRRISAAAAIVGNTRPCGPVSAIPRPHGARCSRFEYVGCERVIGRKNGRIPLQFNDSLVLAGRGC